MTFGCCHLLLTELKIAFATQLLRISSARPSVFFFVSLLPPLRWRPSRSTSSTAVAEVSGTEGAEETRRMILLLQTFISSAPHDITTFPSRCLSLPDYNHEVHGDNIKRFIAHANDITEGAVKMKKETGSERRRQEASEGRERDECPGLRSPCHAPVMCPLTLFFTFFLSFSFFLSSRLRAQGTCLGRQALQGV